MGSQEISPFFHSIPYNLFYPSITSAVSIPSTSYSFEFHYLSESDRLVEQGVVEYESGKKWKVFDQTQYQDNNGIHLGLKLIAYRVYGQHFPGHWLFMVRTQRKFAV
jgi:hypothetical protein